MIVVFGGSFDPVHVGHLILARDVKEFFGAHRVVFVPANLAPFKEHHTASPQDRLNMLRLAVEGEEGFEVDDTEIKRKGVSYTVDTLRELKGRFEQPLYFLMGADAFLNFHRWKEPEEIIAIAGLIVVDRQGLSSKVLPYAEERFPQLRLGESLLLYKSRRIDISSTEIRHRLKRGLSVRYMLPDRVYEYVKSKALYSV